MSDPDDLAARYPALADLARDNGLDFGRLAREALAEGDTDEDRWVLRVTVEERLQMFVERLCARAPGEFHPERLKQVPVLDPVRKWAAAQRSWLRHQGTAKSKPYHQHPAVRLSGVFGSGKTTQAYHIIQILGEDLARRNRSFNWHVVTHRDFVHETHWSNKDAAQRAIEEYLDADLVVLDDLGAYEPTPFARDCTARLVEHRYRDRLPTIYTTNLPLLRDEAIQKAEGERQQRIEVLTDYVDARTVSRIRSAALIECGETDYRALNMGGVIR